jgi:hypothetical protein
MVEAQSRNTHDDLVNSSPDGSHYRLRLSSSQSRLQVDPMVQLPPSYSSMMRACLIISLPFVTSYLDRLCLACWTGKSSGWVWSWWRWSSCCCGMVTSDAVVKLQTFWCKLSSISVLVNLFLIRSSTLHYWILKLGVFYYQYKLRLMAEWIQHCTRTTY